MAPSKLFSIVFSFLFPFGDAIFILQHEEYSSSRALKWLRRFFFRRLIQVREKVVYTARAKVILVVSWVLWLLCLVTSLQYWAGTWWQTATVVGLWLLLIPLIVVIANALLAPLFSFLKLDRQRQAANMVARHTPALKIIAIAGSFGKTTVKAFLSQLLRYHYRVQSTPGTINTPIGIAEWVLTSIHPGTEILIIEMDTYGVGEIARSCLVTPPDIAVLTTIGDQHLERFPNHHSLVKALSEVFINAKPSAAWITVKETAKELKKELPTLANDSRWQVVDENALEYQGSKLTGLSLSASNRQNLQLALKVAELLDVPKEIVLDTCKHLELPERRQQVTEWYGYEAVDDSYNISFTTAQAGIEAGTELAKKTGKKLLVITAGIPELAADQREKNQELGRLLGQSADKVVILGSMFAKEIVQGVEEKDKYVVVPTLQTLIQTIRQDFPPAEWCVLLQPELHDLYY